MAKFNNHLVTYELNWDASNVGKITVRASCEENARKIAINKIMKDNNTDTFLIYSIKLI